MTVITQERDPAFPLQHQGSRLYLLARTDIYQMNPGKGWAHGGHAATQFVFDVLNTTGERGQDLRLDMDEWRMQGGGGFGTKITLALTQAQILDTVKELATVYGLQTGTVVDPTYPFTNWQGDFYTAEELTGGYVFAPIDTPAAALEYLRQFKLHP
jgi:peptidyl-tRNA hydrolase